MAQRMLAAIYERNGAARDVLRVTEVEKPDPAAGEVQVRVYASGVNPADVKNRKRRPLESLEFVIPQVDGAGVIEAVGSGVSEKRIGERVWLWAPHWPRPYGTAAQYISLPSAQAVPLPANIDFEIGACVGIPLLTAYRAVTYDGDVAGQTILVPGGAGSVGHYAIQLAKRNGARVISTVSSASKAEEARRAGADFIVNYKEENVAERISSFAGRNGVDRVLEVNLAINASGYTSYLRTDGTVIVYGSDDWTAPLPQASYLLHGVQLCFFIVLNLPPAVRAEAHASAETLLRSGTLIHRIAARFPLSEIAAAHEAVENGAVGNVIVMP